ncbi:MAG: hypothetical protein AAGI37_19700 [Planctomycetota bacterium]
MAASATKTNDGVWIGGNGKRYEIGTITYDSDATVEVPTGLKVIEHVQFGEAVSGGSADMPSLDETIANGHVTVPAGRTVTVDTASSNSRTFTYMFIGF